MSDSEPDHTDREPPPKRAKSGHHLKCIVHIPGLEYGDVVAFKSAEEREHKLSRLKEIHEKRLA